MRRSANPRLVIARLMLGTATLALVASACAAAPPALPTATAPSSGVPTVSPVVSGSAADAAASGSAADAAASGSAAALAGAATVAAGVVPWIDAAGSEFWGSPLPVTPLPTAGPACRARDLVVHMVGGNGGGGHSYSTFAFVNVGSAPCILQGFPRVVATEPGRPPVFAGHGGFFVGGEQSATIVPGAVATLSLETEENCVARYDVNRPDSTLMYNTVTVSIPGGGALVVPQSFDLLSGLFTGKFGVDPPAPEFTASPIAGVNTRLELPARVNAGTTLHFVVVLENPTTHAMVLDPCPGYQDGIGSGGKDVRALNCAAMPALAAVSTTRFAMELPVPADFPTGPATVFWQPADSFDKQSVADGVVEVAGADRPCTTQQLAAAIAGPGAVPEPTTNMWGAKGVVTSVQLTLTNTSDTPCSVRGAPTVQLTAATGVGLKVVAVDEHTMAAVNLPAAAVVLAAGGIATTSLYWYSSWCAADPNPVTVTLTMPANGATATAVPTAGWRPPPCRDGFAGPGHMGADPLHSG